MRNQNQIYHSFITLENDHNHVKFETDLSIDRRIYNSEILDSNLLSDEDNIDSIIGNMININI